MHACMESLVGLWKKGTLGIEMHACMESLGGLWKKRDIVW